MALLGRVEVVSLTLCVSEEDAVLASARKVADDHSRFPPVRLKLTPIQKAIVVNEGGLASSWSL